LDIKLSWAKFDDWRRAPAIQRPPVIGLELPGKNVFSGVIIADFSKYANVTPFY
jgi:hypothetical protein